MVSKKACKEDDPEFESFMDRMKKKYPHAIQYSLLDRSSSNAMFEVRQFAEDIVGDPIGVATGLKERIDEMRELGKVEFEVIDEDNNYYMEAFLTLKDPCNEDLVKKAIDLDFVWL